MKKIALIFADGSEEIEALTVVDVLRRANVICDIVSVSGKTPTGSHNIKIFADKLCTEFNIEEYDGIVLPGGLPGAYNIRDNEIIRNSVIKAYNDKKLVAAICASPAVVLSTLGILENKKVTCFPHEDFIKSFKNSEYTAKDVEVDGNVITADGPKSSIKFSLSICSYLNVTPKI